MEKCAVNLPHSLSTVSTLARLLYKQVQFCSPALFEVQDFSNYRIEERRNKYAAREGGLSPQSAPPNMRQVSIPLLTLKSLFPGMGHLFISMSSMYLSL